MAFVEYVGDDPLNGEHVYSVTGLLGMICAVLQEVLDIVNDGTEPTANEAGIPPP